MKEKIINLTQTIFRKKYFIGVMVLLVLAVGLPVSISLVKKQTRLFSHAETDIADIYFVSSSTSFTSDLPTADIGLMVDVKSHALAFSRLVITFDQSKIQLLSEPVTFSPFETVIEKTPAAQANSTGRINLVLAVPPPASPSSGLIKMTGLVFGRLSVTPNDSTQIGVALSESQLVNSIEQSITATASSLSLVLNPATSSPSTTPVPATKCCSGKPACTKLTTSQTCLAFSGCSWTCLAPTTPVIIPTNTPGPIPTLLPTPTEIPSTLCPFSCLDQLSCQTCFGNILFNLSCNSGLVCCECDNRI